MVRGIIVSLIAILSLQPVAWAQGDARKILNRTSTEWLKILDADKSPKKRKAALLALKVFGAAEKGVVDGMIHALEKTDETPEVKLTAAQYLGEMGEDAKMAVLPLGKALASDPSSQVREAAAKALGDKMIPFSKPTIPVLGKALHDSDPEVRAAAAATLKDHGKDAHAVLGDLLDTVKDTKTDRFTRMFAAETVRQFSEDADKIVPVFAAVLTEKGANSDLKQVMVVGLARFGKSATGAIDALLVVLRDSNAPVPLRRSAAVTLAKVEADGKKIWPAARELFKSPQKNLREQAIRLAASACKNEPGLVEALKGMAGDQQLDVRLAAVQELGELGPAAKAAEPVIAELARNDPRTSVREAAETALKKIRGG
jgi:HEAT repeat protein